MNALCLRTKLFPYQEQCLEEIEDFNGTALVALEMGLGKTLLSLSYWQCHPEIDKAIVVCPASAQWHWEREARTHLGIRCEVLEGIYSARKKSAVDTSARLLILSYDVLLRRRRGRGLKTWVPFLQDLSPELIIFDEAHLLAGRASQRTVAAQELAKGIKYKLALSGTPLTNRPADLWPTLNILRPDKWGNFYAYAHKFCNARYNKRYKQWDFRGSSKIKLLHKTLKKYCLVRRRKIDVLKDLPPKTKTVVPLSISNQEEYTKATRDFLGWLRERDPVKATKASRMEGLTKIGYLLRLASEGKVKNEIEWITNFLQSDEKLLVFAIHTKILDAIEEQFKDISVRVDGKVLGKKRQQAFDQFNKVEKTRILIGNVDAAGTVWSCTSASNVVFCELPWSPGKVEQAIDRCHGQGRGVEGQNTNAWFLVAHGTLEEKLCEVLQKKQRVITSTLDGKRVKNELEVFDQLLAEIEKELI